MEKNQVNGGKNAGVKKSSAETIFRRELSLLPDDEDRTKRILDRFLLYTHSIKEMEIKEADQALLWLVGIAEEIFMARKQDNRDNLWDINVYLRKVYRFLSLEQDEREIIFPETKKEMLRIILEQWDVQKCDEKGKEIFMFIWDMYGVDNLNSHHRPIEEKKIIDNLFMKRLENAEPIDIKEWVKWIKDEEAKARHSNKLKTMPNNLGRHFASARTRRDGFEGFWWDIRREEIVSKLCISDANDNVLQALHGACCGVLNMNKKIIDILSQLSDFLKLLEGEKIFHKFLWDDHVEIYIFLSDRKRILLGDDWKKLLACVVGKIKSMGLISKTGDSLCFSDQREICVDLFLYDERGQGHAEKRWMKEETIPF